MSRSAGKQSLDENLLTETYLEDDQATAHDAFRALINLSDNSLLAASLSESSFLNFIVSYILVRDVFFEILDFD